MTQKLLSLFLLVGINVCAQNFLTPTLKKSFGNNHHTNRDQSSFVQTDSDSNIIMTGMTERDSTFNDILITKLAPDMALLWKKKLSFETDLSYDVPLATAIDAENNIYVRGDSRGQLSSKVFIVKLETSGNESWRIVFENTENQTNRYLSDVYSAVDTNGTIHLSYSQINAANNALVFYFYTISASGIITSQYTVSDLVDTFNSNFTGLYRSFYYKNGAHYMQYRRLNLTSSPNIQEHFIKKITAAGVTTFALNPLINYSDTEHFWEGTLNFDAQDNIYLSYEANSTNAYKVLKLDSNGNLIYYISSPSAYKKNIGLSYVNDAGNLCVLNNSTLIGSGVSELVLTEYNNSGGVASEVLNTDTYGEKFKLLPDGKMMTQKALGVLQLWNSNLQLINTFPAPTAVTNDFCRLSDFEIIVTETTSAKMFPESNYFSQLDMLTEKINPNAIVSQYHFSGEGTTKIARSQLMADHADNYIVAYHENLGEDNFQIGGALAPISNGFIKYDSQLNVLWTLEIPYFNVRPYNYTYPNYIFDGQNNLYLFVRRNDAYTFRLLKISAAGTVLFDVACPVTEQIYLDQNNNICLTILNPDTFTNGTQISTYDAANGTFLDINYFPEVRLLKSYRSASGDSYIYLISPAISNSDIEKKVYVYKNLAQQIIRPLGIFGATNGIGGNDIDENGTLYFSSSNYNLFKFNKLTLTGDYSAVVMPEQTIRFQLTLDHKLLGFNTAGYLKIYNTDFSMFAASTQTYNPTDVYTLGNYILLNTYYDNIVRAVNVNAELAATFKIPSSLMSSYRATDAQNRLVLSDTEGVQINLNPQYAWTRGYIHKYDIEATVLQNEAFDLTQAFEIKIYPNPATTQITVAVPADALEKVEIFDLTGRHFITTTTAAIDISGLAPALYILKIKTLSGRIVTKKVLKK